MVGVVPSRCDDQNTFGGIVHGGAIGHSDGCGANRLLNRVNHRDHGGGIACCLSVVHHFQIEQQDLVSSGNGRGGEVGQTFVDSTKRDVLRAAGVKDTAISLLCGGVPSDQTPSVFDDVTIGVRIV